MGRLIREGASTLTSGGGVVAPADVAGLFAELTGFTEPNTDGKRNARIKVSYTAPSGWTGKGIHVYIEAPDGSGSNPRARLGAFTLGTSALAPEFTPFDAGKFPYDATNNTPAIIELDAPAAVESWRVYAVSYANEIENPLKPATESGAPPSTLVTVTPLGSNISGEEWAKNITSPTATVVPGVTEAGDDGWSLQTTWSNSPADTRRFGIEVIIRPKGTNGEGDVHPSGVVAAGEQRWNSPMWPIGADLTFDVYFVSVGITGDGSTTKNTVVEGVTPRVKDLFAGKVSGGPGEERAPFVTGLTVGVEYGVSEAGDETYRIYGSWALPAVLTKFRGVDVWCAETNTSLATEKEGSLGFKTDPFPIPEGVHTLTIYAISMDANNRENSITASTPKVIITVQRQGNGGAGVEYAPNVSGFAVSVTDAGIDETGGQRYRIEGTFTLPADVTRYRGLKAILRPSGGTGSTDIVVATAAAAATSFRSEPYPMPSATETYTLYAVSIDANNRANSITGSTPSQIVNLVPGAGTLKLNRADTSSFNSAEFQITSGQFQAKEFAAEKILVGSILRVGGGSGAFAPSFKGANGQIAVYNASNALRAWMGQNGSVYGGWFGELYVGGTGPSDAPLYASNTGLVFIGGNLSGTPYVTVRNSANVEVGRIGASIDASFHGAWFKQLRVGGPNISNPVIQSDASGNVTINGATLTINSGGVTTTVSNSAIPDASSLAGIKVANNSTVHYSAITDKVGVFKGSFGTVFIGEVLSNSGLFVGSTAIDGTGMQSPVVIATTKFKCGSDGASGSIGYNKSAGGTGVITVQGGIIIGIT